MAEFDFVDCLRTALVAAFRRRNFPIRFEIKVSRTLRQDPRADEPESDRIRVDITGYAPTDPTPLVLRNTVFLDVRDLKADYAPHWTLEAMAESLTKEAAIAIKARVLDKDL